MTAHRLITGGEDGAVRAWQPTDDRGIRETTGKWVDAIACGPGGAVAMASSGRNVEVLQARELLRQ